MSSITASARSLAARGSNATRGSLGRNKRSVLAVLEKRSTLGWQQRGKSSTAAASVDMDETSGEDQQPSSNPYYPHLFAPLELSPAIGRLPNRVIMGSMHTGLEGHSIPKMALPFLKADHNHEDLGAMAEYFAERARGGAGLMVTGGVSPNRAGWVGPFAAKLTSPQEMEYHKVVTEAVHAVQVPTFDSAPRQDDATASEKARICLQILHAGRYAMHPFAVAPSSSKSPITAFKARGMSLSEVHQTIRDFVNCAVLAKQAGYDGVEIMSSEGYLINQFLVKRTNHRTDAYGGDDFANRMRFALEIVQETRKAVGEDFILIFRLSMLDLVNDGSSWEEVKMLAQAVEDAGATIINTGIGWHEARVPTIATSVPRGSFAWITKKLRDEKVVNLPLCATNRINGPDVAESILSSDSADLVSMARPFLADPEIVKKSWEGRAGDINTCIACNQACLDHAFVWKTASCLVNPRACHETEFSVVPDSIQDHERLRIGVVGAGPAGLAFATTAATIGHEVILFDKDLEIGGQFNMAKRIPGKEEFHETIRYFTNLSGSLAKQGKLSLQLGTELSYHDDAFTDSEGNLLSMDKWVIATGVDPRTPKIPGIDHPNVLSYLDVLKHKKPVGKTVAIIGAGGIGFDVAEYLLHHGDEDLKAQDVNVHAFLDEWGVDVELHERGGLKSMVHSPPKRQIVLMQRKAGKVGGKLGRTTGWIHRATLAKSGAVETLPNVTYDEIDEKGHLHITVTNKDGSTQKRVLEVDNIVVCAGQVSKTELMEDANDSPVAKRLFPIGGAYEALELDAKRAIDMGTRLALKIHEESVTPGNHVFTAQVGPEEKMMKTIKSWL